MTAPSPASATHAPQATAAWAIAITKKANGVAAGTLHLQLNYTTTLANQTIPGTSVGKLEIQERPLETLDKIAQARIETALETAQERRSGFSVRHCGVCVSLFDDLGQVARSAARRCVGQFLLHKVLAFLNFTTDQFTFANRDYHCVHTAIG